MLSPVPTQYRRRRETRKKAPQAPAPPPPLALTLVSASYDADVGPTLRLTFDRAINIGALHGNQITVNDGTNLGLRFAATGAATLDDPATLAVVLLEIPGFVTDDL